MKYLLTPFIQVNDINGKPIAGAKVYVYGSDTTESVITYQNFDGGLNTDPILTDELGNCTVLVDDDCGLCDVYIYDENDKLIMSKKYITPDVEGGGSSSPTTVAAGYGIIVTQPIGNVFKVSVDTDILATQDDLESKQDKLTGGDNIEITQQNVVNVTGRKQINTVAPLYTVESDNQIYFGLNTDAFVSSAVLNDYLTTAQYAIDSGAYLTQDALSGYATKSELSSTSGILSGALDYISAHGGASYPVSAEEAVKYVTNHSATINEVDLTYQANSGSYITAHQPISSNEWNSNYETVNSNSANWNSTYETLGSNSGIWNDITVYQNNSANYFTTGAANTISSMFSAAIDYVSANAGQGGVSGDYELSAGFGVTLTDFSADHITRIDVTAQGGNPEVENYVTSNSATINQTVSTYQTNSGNYLTAHQNLSYISGQVDNKLSTTAFTSYSADQWEMSAGDGVSFVNDNVNKITRIDVTAVGSSFPITGTNGTASFSADMNSSAIYLSTAQGVAGGTTKFTTKGVQVQAYPSTNVSASWYDLIKGANISSLKLTTAQASYSFTTDEIRHLSQINVATPYTYTGPSTYSVTLGTNTFSNLESGCYYDFMRAEVEGGETWVIGPTGTYSLS